MFIGVRYWPSPVYDKSIFDISLIYSTLIFVALVPLFDISLNKAGYLSLPRLMFWNTKGEAP